MSFVHLRDNCLQLRGDTRLFECRRQFEQFDELVQRAARKVEGFEDEGDFFICGVHVDKELPQDDIERGHCVHKQNARRLSNAVMIAQKEPENVRRLVRGSARQSSSLFLQEELLCIWHQFVSDDLAESFAHLVGQKNGSEARAQRMYAGSFVEVHKEPAFGLEWFHAQSGIFHRQRVQ